MSDGGAEGGGGGGGGGGGWIRLEQGGEDSVGGNGPGQPQNSKGKCIAGAIGSGLLNASIDAIGLIPEGGLVSTAIEGAATSYKGIVKIQQGAKTIQGIKLATGIASTGLGSKDTSGLGIAQTATGLVGLVTTVARATPIVGQVLSGISVGLDLIKTGVAIAHCQ